VRLSAYYFAELLHKFHGQAALAYASYNGGPFNVARWLAAKGAPEGGAAPLELDVFIAEIPFRETANYTRRVLEVQAAYSLMYAGTLPRWSNAVDVRVEDNIDF
jgi:soluble lytic murein transglycosylase